MKNLRENLLFILPIALGMVGILSMFRPAMTAVDANTTVLYDATLGGLPDSQGMSYATYGENFSASSSTRAYLNGAAVLTTTAVMGDYAGYGIDPGDAITQDAAAGFKMTFTVRVEEEAHANNNRSGFNVILLDQNAKGIELGFYEDTIYAREGNGASLFQHAEEISFNTTSETTYELEIINTVYTLTAPGMPTLTGAVRDYSDNVTPSPIIPDPYEEPNFIFLGDNTTSGQAIIHLKYVSITTETAVPTNTPTATATHTTNTPTATATHTAVPANTATPTPTATDTPPPAHTPTSTPTVFFDETTYLPIVINP